MTRHRAWTSRGAVMIAVVVLALLWSARPAVARFGTSTVASATYSTAVLAAPTNLGASVSGPAVILTWTPSTSPGSQGTLLLRAAGAAGPYTEAGSVTRATATLSDTPGPGTWYYEAETYRDGWTSPPAGPVAVSATPVPGWRGQVASGSSVSGSLALTLFATASVPAGDVLVVRTAIGSSVSVSSITDGAGDTYVRQATVADHTSLSAELWTTRVDRTLIAGQPIVVTWSGFSGARQAVVVDDFTSLTTTVDGSGTGSGRSASPSATTPSAGGDLVVAVTAADASSSNAYREAVGWTSLGSVRLAGTGNKALSIYGGWLIAASATTTHAPVLASPARWAEADIALQPAP